MTINCPGCQTLLVTAEPSELFRRDVDEVGDVFLRMGWRVTLSPGFVNAKSLHPDKIPWFKPGRSPLTPSPRAARRAFMVSCRCGRDVLIDPCERPTRSPKDPTPPLSRTFARALWAGGWRGAGELRGVSVRCV